MHEKGNMIESMHTCMRKKRNERVKSRGIMNTCNEQDRKHERAQGNRHQLTQMTLKL